MKQLLVLFSLAAVCSGCVKKPPAPEYQFGRYYFGYEVTGEGAKDVLQVFDDGSDTYLHLANSLTPNLRSLRVKTENGNHLATASFGQLKIVSGIHKHMELEPPRHAHRRKQATLPWEALIYRKKEKGLVPTAPIKENDLSILSN